MGKYHLHSLLLCHLYEKYICRLGSLCVCAKPMPTESSHLRCAEVWVIQGLILPLLRFAGEQQLVVRGAEGHLRIGFVPASPHALLHSGRPQTWLTCRLWSTIGGECTHAV